MKYSKKTPIIPTQYDEVEITSKTMDEAVNKSLNCGALSLLSSGFGAQAEVALKRHSGEEENTACKDGKIFYSRLAYCIMPTASFQLDRNKLAISNDAMRSLKNIESLMNKAEGSIEPQKTQDEDKRSIKEACEKFLSEYGSHINVGIFHVGGIFTWKATFHAKTKISLTEIKSMVSKQCNLSSKGFFLNLATGVADYHAEKGTEDAQRKQLDRNEVHLSWKAYGGPTDKKDVDTWKKELMSNSHNWAIVAKGDDNEDFIGIWELIRNNAPRFRDYKRLSGMLEDTFNNIQRRFTEIKKREDLMDERRAKQLTKIRYPFRCVWGGDPLCNPEVPLLIELTEGFGPGKVIYIRGQPHSTAQRFTINLCVGVEPAFHFDVRIKCGKDENVVVMNTLENGTWAKEERPEEVFPFAPGKVFDMTQSRAKNDAIWLSSTTTTS